jgi:hypothetical protein
MRWRGEAEAMSEKLCRTCEHFACTERDKRDGAHGTCQVIDEMSEIEGWKDKRNLRNRMAFIHSIDEGSYLEVSPAFGCVLWEERKGGDE